MIEESFCVDLSPAGTINRWGFLSSGTPAGVEIPLIGPVTVPQGDQHHLTEMVSQVAKGSDGTLFRVYKKITGATSRFTQVDETPHPDYGTKNIQLGTAIRFLEGESWKVTVRQSIPGRLSLKVSGQARKYDVKNTPAHLSLLDQLFIAGDDFTKAAFDGAVRPNYGECILGAHPGYTPSWRDGSVAGMTIVNYFSTQSAIDLNGQMAGFKYVGLCLGMNDLIAGTSPSIIMLNYLKTVKRLISRGYTPIVTPLPYYAPLLASIQSLNNDLLQYSSQFNIPVGPDLYTWFASNPADVAVGTPVVPAVQGKLDTVRLWAQALDYLYT